MTCESVFCMAIEVFIPMYELLELTECKKCGKIIAEPKELIRIQKREFSVY